MPSVHDGERGSALSARTAERPPAVVHFLFLSFPVGKIEKRRSFVVGFRARARDVVDRERAEGAGGGKRSEWAYLPSTPSEYFFRGTSTEEREKKFQDKRRRKKWKEENDCC